MGQFCREERIYAEQLTEFKDNVSFTSKILV